MDYLDSLGDAPTQPKAVLARALHLSKGRIADLVAKDSSEANKIKEAIAEMEIMQTMAAVEAAHASQVSRRSSRTRRTSAPPFVLERLDGGPPKLIWNRPAGDRLN